MGGGVVHSIILYTTSIVTLDESPGCIYFGVCVSDICINAVCHISELRPEALQLNYCDCVHNLDENPVYIAKEVYFVSPPRSCCIFNCEIFPAAQAGMSCCLIYPRMHLQLSTYWLEYLIQLSNKTTLYKSQIITLLMVNNSFWDQYWENFRVILRMSLN